METGTISVTEIPGGIDLQSTLESGQTYCWWRTDGRMYDTLGAHGGTAWYETVVAGELLRVRQQDAVLEWEASCDAHPLLVETLRLEDDLDEIASQTPDDPLHDAAFARYPGMRIVRDPFFPTLISFICSAQMRVERIFEMQETLRRSYGTRLEWHGEEYAAFPTPDQLASATEAELRELGLGYRAPYVQQTAELVAAGELTREDVLGLEYEAAREALTGFVGVGDKVADCVALFSLGYLEAVPLDTWIRGAIEAHYPEAAGSNYTETSRGIRERLGGEYAGYAQTYLFHYLRSRD